MRPILLVGCMGSMGRRYQAILKHLEVPYIGVDEDTFTIERFDKDHDYHSVIIATPTHTHATMIKIFHRYGIPMLCEKPISMKPDELKEILALEPNLRMVCQYKYLLSNTDCIGHTHYNYFKTGGDGLAFDCISIIGLSNTFAHIANDSPIWSCVINGTELSIKDMDNAYCKMIVDWISRPTPDLGFIDRAHRRVFEKEYHARDTDWHTSEI